MKQLGKKVAKYFIFNILGEKNFYYLYRTINRIMHNYRHKLIIKSNLEYIEFKIAGKEVFFGYYDVESLNKKSDKLLSMVVDSNTPNTAEIGYFDVSKKTFNKLANTNAWNWQMGSRLRWFEDDKLIMFNSYEEGEFCSIVCDLNGKVTKKYSRAFYDIDLENNIGYYTDFSILDKLRKGYGYSNKGIDFENYYDEKSIGIYSYNMVTHEERRLFSVEELRKINPQSSFEGKYHYINHISASKYDEKLMFFHIWSDISGRNWNCRMIISTNLGNIINVIDDFDAVSHYCWKNESEILVTIIQDKKYQYRLYDVYSGKYVVVGKDQLNRDGHPNFIKDDVFVSDTYPNELSMQMLFLYDVNKGVQNLCEIFSTPYLIGEKRCDLHPRYNNGYINFDSNIYGKRCQFLINVNPLQNKN